MRVSLQSANAVRRKRNTLKTHNRINKRITSSIDIDKLLQSSSAKVIQADSNGVLNIDYMNQAQRDFAEDWLRD